MKSLFILFVTLFLSLSTFASGVIPDSSKFIAAVMQTEYGVEVWINTKVHWEERGYLVDGYTSEEWKIVDKITDAVGLCNLAESQYESCGSDRTVDQVKASLNEVGVETPADFQHWAENEVDY